MKKVVYVVVVVYYIFYWKRHVALEGLVEVSEG